MKIWFDLSNSPHINMFHDMIRELESRGHEVIITSRPLANTVELLDQRGLKHTIIGDHYGKNIYKKIFGYPIRVWQLRNFLKDKQIDIAVSQSSFHSPVVAKLLGIPSIYTNDNEHAMGNKPAFIFATTVMIPENLDVEKVVKAGASRKKIISYPGVKEGIYLWSMGETIHKNRSLKEQQEIRIYVRPEPQTAQYYKGGENFLDETLAEIQHRYKVIVLPRNQDQSNHYKQPKFSGILVPEKPISFSEIAENCTLFIGAGGSMTRELAILGIPTISVYQDELLDVDCYLLKSGLMSHEPKLSAKETDDYISKIKTGKPATELMDKGRQAYQLFIEQIEKNRKI